VLLDDLPVLVDQLAVEVCHEERLGFSARHQDFLAFR
jgi:hypothetical protein